MKFTDVLHKLNESKEEFVIVKRTGSGRYVEYLFLQKEPFVDFKANLKNAIKFKSKDEAQKELNSKFPKHMGTLYVSDTKPFIGQ